MGHGKYIDPFAGLTGHLYRVQAGEHLDLQFVVLPGESRSLDVRVDLCGEGASASIKALYLCRDSEEVRIRVLMHHRSPACHSTQLISGIAGGQARVHFDGTIVVAPDAQKTEAYQENHNMVLTPEALVETRPSWKSMPTMSNAPTEPPWASSGRMNSFTCARGAFRKRKRA